MAERRKYARTKAAASPFEYAALMNEESFLEYFCDFLDAVKASGYEMCPTVTEFARWAEVPRKLVHRFIRDHQLREQLSGPVSDCLVEGGMKKCYEKTLAIFTLKNWCGWVDRKEVSEITGERKIATKEEAEKNLREFLDKVQ